jgi:hypothetical protein
MNHSIVGFEYTYNIKYWTPEIGVILYSFEIAQSKSPKRSFSPSKVPGGSSSINLLIAIGFGLAGGYGLNVGSGTGMSSGFGLGGRISIPITVFNIY